MAVFLHLMQLKSRAFRSSTEADATNMIHSVRRSGV